MSICSHLLNQLLTVCESVSRSVSSDVVESSHKGLSSSPNQSHEESTPSLSPQKIRTQV